MNYAHKRGFDEIRQSLETLAQRHGERFKPDEGWGKGSGTGTRDKASATHA